MVGDDRPHVSWTPAPAYKGPDMTLPPTFIDTKETRAHYARYLTDVTAMDAEMGKVYDWAKATFGTNFIFMYSADHGAQWPFGKWNLYDAGIKVPMVFVSPGRIAPGARTPAMVSWLDILPTFFDWAGVALPAGLDGRSFKPVLTGAAASHRTLIFTTHSADGEMNIFPIRSVRNAKYKYILNPYPQFYHSNHSDIDRLDGAGAYWDSWDSAAGKDSAAANIRYRYYVRPKEEFYDLENAPFEQRNLIGKNIFPAQVGEMRKQVADWLAEQKDTVAIFGKPYPITGPRPGNTDTIRPWRPTVALSRWHPEPRPRPTFPLLLIRGAVDETAIGAPVLVRPDGRVGRARPRIPKR
jgi:N-sulfoglucosamine sulfohydrolase